MIFKRLWFSLVSAVFALIIISLSGSTDYVIIKHKERICKVIQADREKSEFIVLFEEHKKPKPRPPKPHNAAQPEETERQNQAQI